METSIVTTKGQIVIPSIIRNRYKIKKGTKVYFLEHGDDIVLRPVTNEYIDGLKGIIKTNGRALKALLDEKKKEREL